MMPFSFSYFRGSVSVSAAILRPTLRRASTDSSNAVAAAAWGGRSILHSSPLVVSCSSSSSSDIRTTTTQKNFHRRIATASNDGVVPPVPTAVPVPVVVPTNGKYLNYAMLYHDSVAFLLSNQLVYLHTLLMIVMIVMMVILLVLMMIPLVVKQNQKRQDKWQPNSILPSAPHPPY